MKTLARTLWYVSRNRTLQVTLCAASLAVGIKAQDGLIRKPGERLETFVNNALPEKTHLAHKIVTAVFGPSGRNVVALVRPANTASNFTGIVLVPAHSRNRRYKKYTLTPMQEIDGRFDITIKSIFTANADKDAEQELVVLYEYYLTGSGNDSGYAACVYDWNGRGFVTLGSVNDKLANLRTSAAVRDKLKAMLAGEDERTD